MSDMSDEKSQELARRRRDELTVKRCERDVLAKKVHDTWIALQETLAELRAVDGRCEFLAGWIEARRLP